MKNELSKKKLKKMISTDFTDLSTEEIKALIQKEVDKGSDKIDTDYIDLCFELLSIKNNKQNVRKARFTKPTKALLAAAVLMVVFISTISVSAQFNLDIPQKIARLINGNAEIDYHLDGADTTADGYALLDTDLAKQLADYGITPVTFPEEMIKENSKIIKINDLTSDKTISTDVEIEFNYNNAYASLSISQYADDLEWVGESTVTNIKSGERIKVNGMDVLIFERKDYCIILYKDNLTTYEITVKCDLETAIEFVKSIK